MPRAWLWLQLVIGWLPVWALFVTILLSAHPTLGVWAALAIATRMAVAGALLGPLVARVVRRWPWPHPMRGSFVALHFGAASIFGVTWFLLNSALESLLRAEVVLLVAPIVVPFLVLGVWLYVMIAGVLYSADAATRASRADVAAAQAQLAALRGQLHPHFLFNALHTVVQLTATAPARAAQAAEDLAGLLRATVDEDRDRVPLADEWAVVERYLAIERMRFGDRLVVRHALAEEALDTLIPAFALQTLVENAVRHGAAPRVQPTTIAVSAARTAGDLRLEVTDDGGGASPQQLVSTSGTGLRRLRARLQALYGTAASLQLSAAPGGGVRAVLTVPAEPAEPAA